MSGDLDSALPMFHEGLFEIGVDGPRLVGARCRACGRMFHPRPPVCLDCLADDLEERRMAGDGRLECFTTVQMPAVNFAPPYSVGYVRLAEGPRVFAPVEARGQPLRAGTTMRLATCRLGREPDVRLAYCFVPA